MIIKKIALAVLLGALGTTVQASEEFQVEVMEDLVSDLFADLFGIPSESVGWSRRLPW